MSALLIGILLSRDEITIEAAKTASRYLIKGGIERENPESPIALQKLREEYAIPTERSKSFGVVNESNINANAASEDSETINIRFLKSLLEFLALASCLYWRPCFIPTV